EEKKNLLWVAVGYVVNAERCPSFSGGEASYVCPAWAFDWRCKTFYGVADDNHKPKATASP
ncbi:MAG: hypothetical protein OER77_18025, partial [Myxococcales bacterium]|nr:hypothetical protein [Myxococcales bacterium]